MKTARAGDAVGFRDFPSRFTARAGLIDSRSSPVRHFWLVFIDTHDRTRGRFPVESLTQDQFLETYRGFEAALQAEGGFATGAHLNLEAGKAYCVTAAESEQAVFAAHEKIGLPYDSICQVRRVTGMDMR